MDGHNSKQEFSRQYIDWEEVAEYYSPSFALLQKPEIIDRIKQDSLLLKATGSNDYEVLDHVMGLPREWVLETNAGAVMQGVEEVFDEEISKITMLVMYAQAYNHASFNNLYSLSRREYYRAAASDILGRALLSVNKEFDLIRQESNIRET